jgi:small subunit ribosomal protein S16
MLKVKLFLKGKKNQRTFRIVIAEARGKRDGKYVDDLGWWNPQIEKGEVDQEKLQSWIKKGALVTQGTQKILDLINSK